jgi:putative PEP-CTERM system TPR-repeat lipoprotein
LLALAAGCSQQSPDVQRSRAVEMEGRGEFREALIELKNAAQAQPRDARTRYLLARVHLDLGDSLTAEKEARQALKLGYAEDEGMTALAEALVLQGQHQKALDETALAKPLPALLATHGDALLALDRRDEARTAYEAALRATPTLADAQLGIGRLAYVGGDAAGAAAAVDRVLKADPKNTDALMFKADLTRAGDHPEQAMALYDAVLAVSPQHRTARVEKAYLAIGLRQYDVAQAELDKAAKATPGSLLMLYTQALLDYSRDKPAAARDVLYKVLKAAPEHMPSVLLAGAVNLRLESYYLAEHHLRHYLERYPDNLRARKMLASALLGTGHPDAAREVIEAKLGETPDDAQMLALAAESNLRTRRFGQAADLFAQASAIDADSPLLRTALGISRLQAGATDQALRELDAAAAIEKDSTEAGEALVRAWLQMGKIDQAQQALALLEQRHPGKAAVQVVKGQVLTAAQRPDDARAAFARALVLDPSAFAAATGLVGLELAAGKPAQARQHLVDFVAHNKTSVPALSALATLAVQDKDEAAATRWLEQAAAVDPVAIGPGVNLSGQYLRTGQKEKALNLALKLQVAHPEDPDLLDLLGKAQLASGDMAAALESYKTLAAALPRSATALMQIAALRLQMNNTAQAENDLQGVLAMQPDFPAAQLALAELYVRKGSFDLALLQSGRMQRLHPKAAAGYHLEGDIQMAKRKPAEALAAYERALALAPSAELAIKIDNALRAAGRQPEADKRLAAWLAAHPNDLRAQAYRAQAWSAAGDNQRAAAELEAMLKRAPGNVVALNNLALAYQKLGDARALPTAEAAYKLAEGQPNVIDTLAWILVDGGQAARAVTLLRRAQELAPGAQSIRYHLAAALAAAGQRDAARKELDAVLAGDMQFAQAEDARRLSDKLKGG